MEPGAEVLAEANEEVETESAMDPEGVIYGKRMISIRIKE